MALPVTTASRTNEGTQRNFLLPLILVTSLFFLWGLAYGLLDVLNKFFQDALNITKTRSTLLQLAYFGAYFLVALPAGNFMSRFGYKNGIITGLLLYAIGAFLFYPSAQLQSFPFFLISLFILASGLTFLETAANPYVTVLGKPGQASFRLNLSQSFNGVGAFLGPLLGASLFFGDTVRVEDLGSVQIIYLIIAGIVLAIAALFWRVELPDIREADTAAADVQSGLFQRSHFVWAVVTQFFYVAAQVGIAALFINYCTEAGVGIDNAKAAGLLSIALMAFTVGRFVGSALMRIIEPGRLLACYALINVVLCLIVVFASGWLSIYSLIAIFFFESIMFPTIFALGVRDLGASTKRASSFIVMSIAGGAIMPFVMGMLAETSTAKSYLIPLFCFVLVAWYGWRGYGVRKVSGTREV